VPSWRWGTCCRATWAACSLPWGSHWRIDHRWSSGRLLVDHFDPRRNRYEKLEALADHELARRHLQVCWQKTTARGNCSRCAKCATTMLVLQGLGVLDAFGTFDPREPWRQGLTELGRSRYQKTFERVLASAGLDGELRQLVEGCLERSVAPVPTPLARRIADALGRP
jgi:hypothetical protein